MRDRFESSPDVKESPAAVTICCDPHFQQTSEYLNIYLHSWDGPKTWYRTSLP